MRTPIRLKHVASVAVSNVDKKAAEGQQVVRLCNYTDVYYHDRIKDDLTFMEATASDSQIAQFRLQPGDVVITKDSETPEDIAVPALVEADAGDLICGYHLAIIRPDRQVLDPCYLFWTLASIQMRSRFSAEATGVTRFGLRTDSIANAPLDLPNLHQQRKIAEFLDAETARIDALKEKRRRMVGLLSERRLAALEEVMSDTGGESLPLRRVVSQFVDYRGATPEKAMSGVPLVTATNVSDGQLDLSLGEQFVSETTYGDWMRRGFPEVGDALLTTEAPLGEVARISEPRVALAQRLILLKPNLRRVTPEFLYASLRSPQVQADLLSRATGSTVWGIRADRLRDVRLHVPSLSDQDRVANVLAEVERDYQRGKAVFDRQVSLLLEKRAALITSTVTGEIHLGEAA